MRFNVNKKNISEADQIAKIKLVKNPITLKEKMKVRKTKTAESQKESLNQSHKIKVNT